MSQRDGFASGFLAGTIVGSIIGGVIGAVVASKISQTKEQDEEASLLENGNQAGNASDANIEKARRSLESKIAQLNLAIDDVRQQMGSVHVNNFEQQDD